MVDSIYDKLSKERKSLQEQGLAPEWMTTGGFQLFKEKYQYGTDKSYRGQCERISDTAARHTDDYEGWKPRFFNLLWKGWLSCSTPVLANMGTGRGLPVSCSGGCVEDSIEGFYDARKEAALLTKYGFGTSSYLGSIRPRGSTFGDGGSCTGVVPVLKGFIQDSRDVSQGGVRRGAWAGYIEAEHGDFWEVADHLLNHPDDNNIGWIIGDEFVQRLQSNDSDALVRYQRICKIKMVTGKGYFFFKDKVNRARPQCYKELGLDVKASNLCNEIRLFSDDNHTFTCVLSSLNLSYYDDWKHTDAVEVATVFLDCVAEEFIQRAKGIKGLEKAVRFTEKSRALGLGVCGFHTLLQKRMLPFGSFEAHMLNNEIFSLIKERAEKASTTLAEQFKEDWIGDEWNNHTPWSDGVKHNTHLIAIAPTKSTALIMGGVSEGINPDYAMVYTQATSAGEVERVNPQLLKIMKERGVFKKEIIDDIAMNYKGSVQHVDWLSPEEKEVFKTAFEINQFDILRLAASRQKWIDQGQSLNLFFSADEEESYISSVFKEAFTNEDIHGIYYVYSESGVSASKGECVACQ